MLSRDDEKGLKQYGDVLRNTRLHSSFSLMCNSTTYHFQTYSLISSGIILIAVESHIKRRDVDVHCGGHHHIVSGLFRHPCLTLSFLQERFLILVCTLIKIIPPIALKHSATALYCIPFITCLHSVCLNCTFQLNGVVNT